MTEFDYVIWRKESSGRIQQISTQRYAKLYQARKRCADLNRTYPQYHYYPNVSSKQV